MEEYNPSTARPRRSVSTSYNGHPPPETTNNQMFSSSQPPPTTNGLETAMSPVTPARPCTSIGYFPTMSTLTDRAAPDEPQVETASTQSKSPSPLPEQAASPPQTQPEALSSPTPTSLDPLKLSPAATSTPPGAPVDPRISQQRVPSRPSPPTFALSSLDRPTSVASSASSHLRAPSGTATASKTAPTMAVTDGTGSPDLLPELQRRVFRKASSNSLSPAHEDLFHPSPLSEVSQPINSGSDLPLPANIDGSTSGLAALGTGPAGRLIRGFSIGKKRRSSGVNPGIDGKPTALDMLRRFDGGGG